MKLLIFAASHRPESSNRKLAQLAAAHVAKTVAVDFAEYSEFDMPLYNDVIATANIPDIAQSFAKRAASAQGIIISSPEYNWSYPGSLKNIIDWTSRLASNPLAGKTALLMSATPGGRGGILGLNHLKPPLESVQMHVFNRVFPLSNSHTALDAAGELTDAKQRKNFTAMLDEYIVFTRQLSS